MTPLRIIHITFIVALLAAVALLCGCPGRAQASAATTFAPVAPASSPAVPAFPVMLQAATAPDLLTLAWNPVTNEPISFYTLGNRTNGTTNSYGTVATTTETNIMVVFPTLSMEWSVKATGTNGLSSAWSVPVTYPPLVTNICFIHARFATNFPTSILASGSLWTNFTPITLTNIGTGIGTNREGWHWLVSSNRTL